MQENTTQNRDTTVRYVLCFNDPKIDKRRTDSKKFVQRVFLRLDLIEGLTQLTDGGVWDVYLTSGKTVRVTGFAQGNPLERFVDLKEDKKRKG